VYDGEIFGKTILRDERLTASALNAENCGDQKIVLHYTGEIIGSKVTGVSTFFFFFYCKAEAKI